MNVVDLLDTLIGPDACMGISYKIELRHRKESFADARLYFKERDLPGTVMSRDIVECLAADPNISAVRYKRPAISVRFTDSFIMALGEELEHGGHQTTAVGFLPYPTYMVGFAGPNTNKPLHIGHMRNITIGGALAALLENAGAQVYRHSLVGDIGRIVCEALAGLEDADSQGSTLEGTKADQFVGQCYASYVSSHPHKIRKAGDSVDDPVARELHAFGDRADDLMGRWLAGEREVREKWHRVREAVMEGHRQTLGRLGIRIQRFDYESDALESIGSLVARGLDMGVLESNTEGTVFYRSGRPEFDTMVIQRQGAFPTEHARLIAVYFRLLGERPEGCVYLDLAGSEWKPASDIHMELMERLRPEDNLDSHVQLFHGMVTVRDSKIASSGEGALLIDHLLDDIAESELAGPWLNVRRGRNCIRNR